MKYQILVLFCLVLFNSTFTNGQIREDYYVANWNLENLFDTVDDPGKDDSEFTPAGSKEWDQEKLLQKFSKLSAVINSMNSGQGPDLLSVEEVEHESLLDTLLKNYLTIKNYKIAYAESPDERGIDVGLIYNSDLFKLISTKADTVNLPNNDKTRLILNVILKTKKGDKLFVFVNHWPSRRGGEKESEINRVLAASILRVEVNKILLANADSKILILGDFNDEPGNKSVSETLNAMDFDCSNVASTKSFCLYNLAYKDFTEGKGTILYQSDWNLIDQIIISGNLLRNNYECNSFEIYKPEFLLTRTGKYKGSAFPTYGNKGKYLGGYSDHFPVVAKFRLE